MSQRMDAMIACVDREIEMRRHVYPGLVRRGKMTQEKADHEQSTMRRVRNVLVQLRTENEIPFNVLPQQLVKLIEDLPRGKAARA